MLILLTDVQAFLRKSKFTHLRHDGEPAELLCWIYSRVTCLITASVSLRYLRHTCTQTHLIHTCTKPSHRRTPLLVHLQDSKAALHVIGHNWGGGSGAPKTSRQLHLTYVCVNNLANKGWKVAPAAYVKCIYSHYSRLSPTRGGWPLQFYVWMWSLNPVTNEVFAKINILLVQYLTYSPKSTWTHAADCRRAEQIPARFYLAWQAICHSKTSRLLSEVVKACVCGAGVSRTFIMVSMQTHSKQRVAKEQACCRLYAVTATLVTNPCTHAGGDVPLPRRRLGLEQGVIDMCSTCTKRVALT